MRTKNNSKAILLDSGNKSTWRITIEVLNQDVTITTTNKDVAMTEFNKIRSAGIYAGHWVTKITLDQE